tara:strand:+ start:39 stop:272 length:234 start_codon:yes stop_codon:yes gene_type:complete
MTEEQQPIPTITVDGVEHVIDDLSDEHRTVIQHIQAADQEIQRLQNLIAILSTGRQSYINELGKELNGAEQEFTEGS